ncbi:hypothetical protein Salat_2983500 [Sesamum alatum]|uniref:Uncharacterized protein n=1 Tax=Sesamum alatum TaxID=300844 RepID=A0AAE1XJ14_9LAMI|nr:hypothetical protein Salat_2983500 [Sesamum alatum]
MGRRQSLLQHRILLSLFTVLKVSPDLRREAPTDTVHSVRTLIQLPYLRYGNRGVVIASRSKSRPVLLTLAGILTRASLATYSLTTDTFSHPERLQNANSAKKSFEAFAGSFKLSIETLRRSRRVPLKEPTMFVRYWKTLANLLEYVVVLFQIEIQKEFRNEQAYD